MSHVKQQDVSWPLTFLVTNVVNQQNEILDTNTGLHNCNPTDLGITHDLEQGRCASDQRINE